MLDLDNNTKFTCEEPNCFETLEKSITGGSFCLNHFKTFHIPAYQYATGQSSHLYWPGFFTKPEWIKFLGESIFPKEFVDIRWVGYAMRRGYASLRWSKNTNRNLQIPTLTYSTVYHSQGISL